MGVKKSGVKILLFVEHEENEDPSHSIYLIEPPMEENEEIDSEGFAVDSISPIKTIERGDCCFIRERAMFRLGSRFYFFGGETYTGLALYAPINSVELQLSVQVFDIDSPELGFRNVASLNAPKETPCVFSVKGQIYALGSFVKGCNLGDGLSGIFERYDPDEDYWEVLPDPPKPFGERMDMNWCDSATVVRDRYIYVGNTIHEVYLVFDLDEQQWTLFSNSSQLPARFPYGSLYVDDSLYYLAGIGSWKLGTQFDVDYDEDGNDVRLVKISPFRHVDDPFRLLKSICLKPGNEQVMSTYTQLEGDTWFSALHFDQWRDIFHLGGRFFCYVSTGQLVDQHDDQKLSQPYCRGVWIKVFEEVVPDPNSTTKQPHFRNLASFSYRIRTPFENNSSFIRCSAFGSVPHSWVEAPLSKKQVAAKEREAFKAEQSQHERGGGSEGQRDGAWEKKQVAANDREALKTEQSHEHGGVSEEQMDGYLQQILAVQEDINRLRAELAKKDELLKECVLFLAKSRG